MHLRDYYGEERSPMWDLVDQLKQENQQLEESLPSKQEQIEHLQAELKDVRIQNRAMLLFS